MGVAFFLASCRRPFALSFAAAPDPPTVPVKREKKGENIVRCLEEKSFCDFSFSFFIGRGLVAMAMAAEAGVSPLTIFGGALDSPAFLCKA